MILYSIHGTPGAAMISKWDEDLNIIATYALTARTCDCPSWPRKNHCKHVDMLDKFIAREYLNTNWFYCAETGGWHKPLDAPIEDDADEASASEVHGAFIEVATDEPATSETPSEASEIETQSEAPSAPEPSAPPAEAPIKRRI